MAATQTQQGWASTREAAEYMGFSQVSLRRWRVNRTQRRQGPWGPEFQKVHGQARYRYADLDAYLASTP